MNDNKGAVRGVGASELLGIAFVVLKLCHVIDWPWIWVLTPVWLPPAIVVIVAIFILLR